MVPAFGPPMLAMSANGLSSCSWYSSNSGSCQARSSARLAGLEHLADQAVVVAHQAGGVAAEGDDAGAGQGGDIDHRLRLEALGVGQGVAQHQAAFGVGVEDLHGLPAHGGDDVAGAGGAAAGHVLGAGQQAPPR